MNYTIPEPNFQSLQSLRQILASDLATGPAPLIRMRVDQMFGEGAADAYDEQLESILGDIGRGFSSAARDVGRFAATAAPAVAHIGGGALQGAMAGSALGLPGIIAGAAAGGAGAGLSRYGSGAARQIGGALSGVTGLAGQFSPMGQAGSQLSQAISGLAGGGQGGAAGPAVTALSGLLGMAGGQRGVSPGTGGGRAPGWGSLLDPSRLSALTGLFGGGAATSQLASFLQRPETQRAFGALNLQQLGRNTIPVGAMQTPVPTSVFPLLLSLLADRVSTEAAGWQSDVESDLRYMTDHDGEYVGDPAFDRDRAARAWNLLNESQAERVLSIFAENTRAAEAPRFDEWDADTAYYDDMDEAELFEMMCEDESLDEWGQYEAASYAR